MDRYTLLLANGDLSVSTKDWYHDVSQPSGSELSEWYMINDNESSFLASLTASHRQFVAYCDLDLLKNNPSLANQEWLEISSSLINEQEDDFYIIARLIEHLLKANRTVDINRQNAKLNDDSMDYLHKLADDLPTPGSYILEVVIIISDTGMTPPEDFISLYGFLERLQLWHQARINILDVDDIVSNETYNDRRSDLESWRDVIDFGRIKKDSFSLTIRPSILWSGNLCLRQENGYHTRISGLELRHDVNTHAALPERVMSDEEHGSLILGNEIEVLRVIEDYDIPLHVLCHAKLRLTLRQDCDESSSLFFEVVQEAQFENLCFLACIFYNVSDMQSKALTTPNTKDWLDYVNDKKTEYLVFSDLKKDLSKRCMIIIRGTVDKGSLDVFFLKDNEYFCGDGLRSFLNHEYSISTQGVNENFKARWKLPLLTDEDVLRKQLDDLENLYQSLEDCVHERNYELTNSDDETLWSDFSSRSPKYIEVNDMSIAKEDYNVQYCAANLISPSKWPERLSWNNQEVSASISLKGSLKRFQSAENHMKLKGIPVAPETQCEGVTESFLQMLELFDVLGKPVNENLKRIPLVADRLFKQLPCEGAVRNLPYTKALRLIAHGIDYCLDSQNSLKLDAKLVRIQERFLSDDTSCSCTPAENSRGKPKERQRYEAQKNNGSIVTKGVKNVGDKIFQSVDKKVRISNKLSGTKVRVSTKEKKPSSNKGGKEVKAPSTKPSKESRSQRHQRRLKVICDATLLKYGGLKKDDPLFERCAARLFSLCKSFLKDLKTSEGLVGEMKKLAKSNVNQVVDFEKRGK